MSTASIVGNIPAHSGFCLLIYLKTAFYDALILRHKTEDCTAGTASLGVSKNSFSAETIRLKMARNNLISGLVRLHPHKISP